jgi:hypothetical protein
MLIPVDVHEDKPGYPYYKTVEINPAFVVLLERHSRTTQLVKLFIMGYEGSLIVRYDYVVSQVFPIKS